MSQTPKKKGIIKRAISGGVTPLFSTDTDSLLFVERTVNLAISTILYVRELLPKSEFEDEVFGGMILKVLRKGSDNVSSQRIELWMSGVMDAFKKKFLKSMCFEISDSRNCLILESYIINFYYGAGNDRSISAEKNYTRFDTFRLFQTCLALAKTCSELPEIVSAVLKLSYQENTPPNYQPYGQKYNMQKMTRFLMKPKNIELGTINTGYHHLDFITKTVFSNERVLSKSDERTSKHKASDKPGATTHIVSDIEKQRTHGLSEQDNQLSQLIGGSRGKVESTLIGSSQCTDNAFPASQSDSVRCPCLSRIKTSLMYQCSGCNNWVHAECFGIDVSSTPIEIDKFYCQLCHKLSEYVCQDRQMVELDVAHKQQKLAVKRRLLAFCNRTNNSEVSFKKFEKVSGLECQKELIQTILDEMVKFQIINQFSRDTYTIDKKVAAEKMAEYFYVKSPPVSEITRDMRKKTIVEQINTPLRDGKLKKERKLMKTIERTHDSHVKKPRTNL